MFLWCFIGGVVLSKTRYGSDLRSKGAQEDTPVHRTRYRSNKFKTMLQHR